MSVKGYAIVTENEVLVPTVSPTRVGAIVNWLVVVAGFTVSNDVSDEEVEEAWSRCKGISECAQVRIEIVHS